MKLNEAFIHFRNNREVTTHRLYFCYSPPSYLEHLLNYDAFTKITASKQIGDRDCQYL
jgi:hypothetical protein